jgi:competence protein ComEA
MDEIEISPKTKIFILFSKYKVEFVILAISILFLICGAYVYIKNSEEVEPIQIEESQTLPQKVKNLKITIDLSGSVKKPGVYELNSNSRLKDLIERAGGLSSSADSKYFARNYNLARILVDQEKIYIPDKAEVEMGDASIVDLEDQVNPKIIQEDGLAESSLINVNTASLNELDSLPGVGAVISGRIVSSRPYMSIEELKEKKILNNSLFEKLKNLIVTN